MQLEGTHTFPAPRERVWDVLMDPAGLRACLPGCEQLDPQPDGSFRLVVRAGAGLVRGVFTGSVTLRDPQPPERYTLALDARGSAGHGRGEGTFELLARGDQTDLRYRGEVTIGGMAATLGQRILSAAAKVLIGQFLDCVGRRALGQR
jgi:carbon monoxide dehydrogenase subunit G